MLPEVSWMNFIRGISKEIKWKVKACVTRIIIDELHSWDIQGDQMEAESGDKRSIIDEVHSCYIQGD